MATLSIMGLYNYDETLFDGLQVPSGVNKQDIIDEILMQCAELEVLYPAPSIMKRAIEIWSNSNQIKWQKLYDTMTIEYNPIWNVDANIIDKEKISGSDDRTINRTNTGADTETVNLTDTETRNLTDKETVDLTDTKSVKGLNETAWADAEKNTKGGTDTIKHTGTDTKTHTGTDNRTMSSNENVSDGNISESQREYTQRRTGNIGVTTTQQMLEAERKIADFNLVEIIVNSFKYRFCILVY